MIEQPEFSLIRTPDKLNMELADSHRSNQAAGDIVAYRLLELQCSPIQGGFDSAHLRNIHHFIYRDLFDAAGELRSVDAPEVAASKFAQSLDGVLDRLRSENHLRGLSPDDWGSRASEYLYDLAALRPFNEGTGVALREFATQLARKNQLNLQWDQLSPVQTVEAFTIFEQQARSANLRRLIMLVMDRNSSPLRPNRHGIELGDERSLPFEASLR
jgi:cell filamentation protein